MTLLTNSRQPSLQAVSQPQQPGLGGASEFTNFRLINQINNICGSIKQTVTCPLPSCRTITWHGSMQTDVWIGEQCLVHERRIARAKDTMGLTSSPGLALMVA